MFRKLSSTLTRWILALICIAAFSLMFWAAKTDSAIDDELAHIPAGYGYVHNLDYRLNPEHPPLVKALAMLPVLLLNPNFPTQSTAWQTAINGQWDMGTLFLYQSGNDANAIVQTARVMPILLTILTIIFVYALAKRFIGDWWALVPTFLFAFDPTVLAHGHYVTTDLGATFGIIFATYFFLRYIEAPSTKHLWYAGLAFGTAQLAKFSTPLLIPLFLFLALVLWLRQVITQWSVTDRSRRLKKFTVSGWRYLSCVLLIFIIGYVFIVYPVYSLFTANYPIAKQASDTQFILTSFANGPTPTGQICHGLRCLADADIWMAKSPLLRPYGEYLLGILMALQRSSGGNTIYFLGQVVNAGGWMYFPILFLLKEPIPTLVIIALALFLAALNMLKKRGGRWKSILDYLGTHFGEFGMASFVVLYWGYSMRSPLNIGLRHMLPTLPLIYILSAGVLKKWAMRFNLPAGDVSLQSIMSTLGTITKSFFTSTLKYIFVGAMLVWLFLETLIAAPYFLSYFNEFASGTWNGYHYVTDSNYDWGQDLLRLQTWVDEHNKQCTLIETNLPCGIDKIAVDYFGGGSPKYYLGDASTPLNTGKEIDWSSSKGNPASQGIHWLAISVNQLQGSIQPLGSGQTRNASDTYSWLTALRPPEPGMGNVPAPDYRVGTSIFIYKL